MSVGEEAEQRRNTGTFSRVTWLGLVRKSPAVFPVDENRGFDPNRSTSGKSTTALPWAGKVFCVFLGVVFHFSLKV